MKVANVRSERERERIATEKLLEAQHTRTDNRGVFMPPFFYIHLHNTEFIYSLKKHTKRALYNTRQKGRDSSTPWALCVHVPANVYIIARHNAVLACVRL